MRFKRYLLCYVVLSFISFAPVLAENINSVFYDSGNPRWIEAQLVSDVNYVAIAYHTGAEWAMAAREDGGLDAIQYTTSWQATPLVGGVASMTFNALCYDGGNMFAANAAGGVGTIGYVTSWEYTPLLGGQVTGTYAALCKNNQLGWYYGTKSSGGVNAIVYSNNVWGEVPLISSSVKYVAIADHITNGWAMAAREDGGVDAIHYTTSWQAVSLVGTVSDMHFNALCWDADTETMFAADAAGGVGTIYYDSQVGGWVYTALLGGEVTGTYSALCKNNQFDDWYYGSKSSGGVNAVTYYYSDAGWKETNLITNGQKYLDLATHFKYGWAMAVKYDGGLDAIQYDTSWQVTPLVGGVSSMAFNALCYDGNSTSGIIFAADANGGVGTIGYVTSWEYTPLLGGQVTGTYAALCKNNQLGWYYGTKSSGGVNAIFYSNNVWGEVPLISSSVKYVAIADHITNGWAMAAREDGGVDAIVYDNGWKAVPLAGTISDMHFNDLCWDANAMFAANAAGGVGTIYYDPNYQETGAGLWVYTELYGDVEAKYSALSPHQTEPGWFYGAVYVSLWQEPGSTFVCSGKTWNNDTASQELFDYDRYWNLQYGDITVEWTYDFTDANTGQSLYGIDVPAYAPIRMSPSKYDTSDYDQQAVWANAGLTWGVPDPVSTVEFAVANAQASGDPKDDYRFYGTFPGVYSSTALTCTQGYSYSSGSIHTMTMTLHYNSDGHNVAYLWVDGNPQLDAEGQQVGIDFNGDVTKLFLVKAWNNYGYADKGSVVVGDITVSQGVNLNYLALFADKWLNTGCSSVNEWCATCDWNEDGTVNLEDFAELAAQW